MAESTLGARLKATCDLVDLSLRELDRLAGLTPGHSRQAVAFNNNPTSQTCIAWARVLGVSLDWLCRGDEHGKPPKRAAVLRAVEAARAQPAE